MNINLINFLLALGSIAMQISIIILLIIFILKKKNKENKIYLFFQRNAYIFIFIIAILGTIISLFYSEIVKIPPCSLCWIQRSLLYPQILILGIAIILKWRKWWIYSLILSIAGFGIALYQIILQFSTKTEELGETAKCFGGSIDCSAINILEFGYITFPFISMISFLLIIVLILFRFKE